MENRETFLQSGGEEYRYIPCLNDHATHIDLFASLVKQQLHGWLTPTSPAELETELTQRKARALAAGADA
jgi:ferrochelatase